MKNQIIYGFSYKFKPLTAQHLIMLSKEIFEVMISIKNKFFFVENIQELL